ncbi:unnamed protein product [Diatraea saccharalis]|uniref:Alcohol dehydrogenase n=1 Tax=Diatraea saccharalis TaxID=40085 RepID=A0A9N9WDJ1_9NEOP|nr:unnamed protein product [Diatraea saccharalis]
MWFRKNDIENDLKKVALLDIAEDLGKATAEKLNDSYPGTTTIFIECDVSKEESIVKGFDEVIKAFETIDVIINNAGILNDSPHMWRTACDVNWQGLVSFTLRGLNHMKNDNNGKGGTIINISSLILFEKMQYLPIYTGSKSAVLSFGRTLTMGPFFENTGVRILTMCFGATNTPMLQNSGKCSYDTKYGDEITNQINATYWQKPESAVRGVIDIFKQGECGSIWVVNKDKPAVNITSIINDAYESIEKAIFI